MKFLLVIAMIVSVKSATIRSDNNLVVNYWDVEQQVSFLNKYGYLNGPVGESKNMSDLELSKALKLYQKIGGLNATGIMDDATHKLMNMPRCGNSDKELVSKLTGRSKRYSYMGSKWRGNSLTYRIVNVSSAVDQAGSIAAIDRAFQEWAKVSNLQFNKVSHTSDIDLYYVSGVHGGFYHEWFDGRGGVIAHASSPIYGGDIHFDNSEPWELNGGIDVFQVAVHEIGHALGLGHSRFSSAVMNAVYQYRPSFQLSSDDIAGIQSLYGGIPQQETINFCDNPSIDAIVNYMGRHTIVFKGNYVALLDYYGIADNYPKKIQDVFPDLPDSIDAAVHLPKIVYWWCHYNPQCVYRKAETYFFKDSTYYLYRDNKFYESGPISAISSNLPSSIDAAFTFDGLTVSYIKGNMQYNIRRDKTTFEPGFPRVLSISGLPSSIDDVIVQGYNHYYFSGQQYYRVRYGANYVDTYGYPKQIASALYGCQTGYGNLRHNDTEPTENDIHFPDGEQNDVYIDVDGRVIDYNSTLFNSGERLLTNSISYTVVISTLMFVLF